MLSKTKPHTIPAGEAGTKYRWRKADGEKAEPG